MTNRSEFDLLAAVTVALDRGVESALRAQATDGRWEGFNDAGPYFTALAIILETYLGAVRGPSREQRESALRGALLESGGVSQWPGDAFGHADVTAMWLGAARALGIADDDRDVARARDFLRSNGGWDATEPLSRVFLAVAGVLPAGSLPPLPLLHPLLPSHERVMARLFGVNLLLPSYLIPAVVGAVRRGGPPTSRVEKLAARRVIKYLTERQDDSGGWMGLSFYTLLAATALVSLGVARDDGRIVAALSFASRSWRVDENGARFSPFYSTFWDTAQMVRGLRSAGVEAGHPALVRAADYLLAHQSRMAAPWDWQTPPKGAPASGGWAFQPGNERNPDLDSTQEVLGALAMVAPALPQAHGIHEGIQRGARWFLAMQNPDGGWAAFSWGKASQFAGPAYLRGALLPPGGGRVGPLVRGALLAADALVQLGDPSTADVAGRSLETLALLGRSADDPAVTRAVEFVRAQRYAGNGVWWGRWAVNFVPTTCYVLCGLLAAGVSPKDEIVEHAIEWLLRLQRADGGWGDTPESYASPWRAGEGPSMASITGFALRALCAAGLAQTDAAARAAAFLLAEQRPDGSWLDARSQGVMIPHWLYYQNDTFSTYLALESLGMFVRGAKGCG